VPHGYRTTIYEASGTTVIQPEFYMVFLPQLKYRPLIKGSQFADRYGLRREICWSETDATRPSEHRN